MSAIVVAQRLRFTAAAQTRLDLCLRSVLAEALTDELVIVDLGNDAEISSMLRAFQVDRRDVKLLAVPSDVSAAAAANEGAKQSRGRWLLFLDPDVVLQRGAVGRLAAAGGAARTPCIIGGRLTDI
ncbi:MAG: glycosyltransferase family 2 protein, partial [Phycisphaerales bacterium]|nr:glycosyltransferase family 2 protein [Hyphomonadaceae bacterium]